MKYIKCIIISFSSRCACRILYRTSNRFKLKKNFRYFGINFENTIGLVLKVCLIYSEFIGCLLLNAFFHFYGLKIFPLCNSLLCNSVVFFILIYFGWIQLDSVLVMFRLIPLPLIYLDCCSFVSMWFKCT
jgi:hypothetical protein